jgi:hypothetical protein
MKKHIPAADSPEGMRAHGAKIAAAADRRARFAARLYRARRPSKNLPPKAP